MMEKNATPFPEEKSLQGITEDGKWKVDILLGIESTVQITSIDGKIKWVLDEKNIPDVRVGQLWNYKTSNDGNSMYFGLGGYHYETIIMHRWPPDYGLYKLNLKDGSIETILKPHMDSSGQVTYETHIIYSWWDEPVIFLRNLVTLDEQSIYLPDNYKIAGPFVWSPNEMSVMFTMWSNAWDYPADFVLVRMDMDDKSIHFLYSDNEKNRFFVPVKWAKDDVVYLVNRGFDEWQINPFTGQLQKRVQSTP
jgi:hypothetical protein